MRIEIHDLGKRYPGGLQALEGVSLTMDRGLFGLLGPNGAGKTTLMKIACTLLEPSSGRVLVDGRELGGDRQLVRARLGYLPQDWGAPRQARCREVIDLVLRLRGMHSRAERAAATRQVLADVGLERHLKTKVKALSGGMLRRLGVAQALAGSPELIVLDEPTVGLDPDERVAFRNLLSELGRDRTIVLSTHIVADVGNTCEQVGVLDRGRVRYEGPPAGFAAKARGRVHEALVNPETQALAHERLTVVSSVPSPDGPILRVVGDAGELPAEPNGPGTTWQDVEPTLEDAYLSEVGADALLDDALEAPGPGEDVMLGGAA